MKCLFLIDVIIESERLIQMQSSQQLLEMENVDTVETVFWQYNQTFTTQVERNGDKWFPLHFRSW